MAASGKETRVGFIGLGQAGKPMARAILRAGFPMVVYDLREEPVTELVSLGATPAGGPKELAGGCDVIVTSLPHPSVSEEVVLGANGVLRGARDATVVVETSTVQPSLVRRMDEAGAAKGIWVVDAGISGIRYAGGAEGPWLTMMVGAAPEAMDRARPVLEAVAARIFHVGPPGMGMTLKLVTNAMSMAYVPIFCEGIALGMKAGADPVMLYEVLTQTGANNPIFAERFPNRVLKGNYEGGMSVDLSAKDLALVLAWAREMGVPLFVLPSVYGVHEWARATGLGSKDRSVLITLWEEMLGIKASGRLAAGTGPTS